MISGLKQLLSSPFIDSETKSLLEEQSCYADGSHEIVKQEPLQEAIVFVTVMSFPPSKGNGAVIICLLCHFHSECTNQPLEKNYQIHHFISFC